MALAGLVSLFCAARLGAVEPAAESPAATKAGSAVEEQAAYIGKISKQEVMENLAIDDPAQALRVRDLIVNQYGGLRDVHAARDAKIAEAARSPGADPTVLNAWVGVASAQANIKLLRLHRWFVARLAAELTPEQVERVKNGLTGDVAQTANKRYLAAFPNLTAEQKRDILANLLEARDYAMDAGSAEEQRAIFQQYQAKVNDYLSQAGYDVKPAEHDIAVPE